MRDTKSLFVPILSNGDGKVMADFMMSFMVCLSRCPTIRSASFADSLVARTRNVAAAAFLKTECEFLLFWDADIVAQAIHLDQLCENDDDILCGIYPKKQVELSPVFSVLPGHKDTPAGGVIEVARSGTGFMRIHRSVLERMKSDEILYHNHGEPQWNFFPVGVVNGEYLSEDWAFCDRARAMGIKIMLDSRIQLGHQGVVMFPIRQPSNNGPAMHVPTLRGVDSSSTSSAGVKLELIC